ncbi:MAG: glutamate 5-kinase [Pseudomonadota bacterium]
MSSTTPSASSRNSPAPSEPRAPFAGARRIVVKLGSALVAAPDGAPAADLLAAVATDVAALARRGIETAIVSSGAVALGRAALGEVSTLEQKQAAAAIGQARLMAAWGAAFAPQARAVGQVLLTLADTEDRRRYLNARAALDALLAAGAIPIINENDTVATDEIRYGDNDRLAAHAAQIASADVLALLTDVDGYYSADPRTDQDARLATSIAAVTDEMVASAGGANAVRGVGSGGMRSKLEAARIAARAGARTLIARGVDEHPLLRLENGAPFTEVAAVGSPASAREKWLAGRLRPRGVVRIDAGAAAALKDGASVLAAGVVAVEGAFERGDAVRIEDAFGAPLAVGVAAYGAADAQAIKGLRSEAIEGVLGYRRRPALVHRNDLALLDRPDRTTD